jgi:hypothetical protein
MPAFRTRIIVFLFVAAAAAAFAADPAQMSVKVKETQVRVTPSALAKIVGVLSYCDRVTVVEQKKDWTRISFPEKNVEGWVSASALQAQKILRDSGSEDAQKSVTSRQAQLAGLGFNKETEQEYRTDQGIDYTWVDTMEGFTVSTEEKQRFLADGGLSLEGGAE